jgi:2-iminoacetate synthase ThiH
MFVPSAAETKKNGKLCLAANLNSFLVTYNKNHNPIFTNECSVSCTE